VIAGLFPTAHLPVDRDTVPALLAVPDCAITGLPDGRLREFVVCRFEFLQAADVRLGFGEPAQQHRKAAVNAVHVEGRDLHVTRFD